MGADLEVRRLVFLGGIGGVRFRFSSIPILGWFVRRIGDTGLEVRWFVLRVSGAD